MGNIKTEEKLCKYLNDKVGVAKTELMLLYLREVLEYNKHINLTRVIEWSEAIEKHIVDSLACLDIPAFQRASKVCDIGTGAGFPGAILAIAAPEKQFLLLDSRKKRLKVIEEILCKFDITNVELLHQRAQDINSSQPYYNSFDCCTCRAVGKIDYIIQCATPLLKEGAHLLAYKGDAFQSELPDWEEKDDTIHIHKTFDSDERFPSISGHVIVDITRH